MEWIHSWLPVLAIGALAGFAVWLCDRDEKRKALQHMANKPPLTDAEFGRRYFKEDRAEVAARLRQILSRHIAVDLSRLHPDDKLVEDIRMDALDSLSTVEFVIDVEKEFGISVPDSDAEKMKTLGDVVEYVALHRGTTVN